jgi:dTDP-4-amino-4,6-dideoxygalactose transaminase
VDTQRRLEREIEAFAARRTGRESVFMPSGRIALYCALRALLSPGDRILMSPVNDDVIFFVVLAAGLRPVAAPLSAADGNIDVEAIPSQTWTEVRAVLTTNLYGLPDRMAALRQRCDAHGLVLIEDVAHAIETEVDGAPVGAFGEAAAFSLSKHVDAYRGGVLAVADPRLRGEVERIRAGILAEPSVGRRVGEFVKPPAKALLEATGILRRVRKVREAAAARHAERPGNSHRMDLMPDALRRAIAGGPVLAAFDPWVRVDRHDYAVRPTVTDLGRILERLRGLDADRERRIRGVERLCRELDCVTPGARSASPLPLFRVALLVADREAAMAALAARGVLVRYVYDPPLDDYAGPEFIAPSPAPAAGRWWVRHALPIDPLTADAALPVLRGLHAARGLPAAP